VGLALSSIWIDLLIHFFTGNPIYYESQLPRILLIFSVVTSSHSFGNYITLTGIKYNRWVSLFAVAFLLITIGGSLVPYIILTIGQVYNQYNLWWSIGSAIWAVIYGLFLNVNSVKNVIQDDKLIV
jgi:hypothetical protein